MFLYMILLSKKNIKQIYLALFLGQSEPGSNGNAEQLHTPEISRTGVPPSDAVPFGCGVLIVLGIVS